MYSVRRINDFGNMAANGAALAEVRAGIMFGVTPRVHWFSSFAISQTLSHNNYFDDTY